jgi:two-component system, LytTR family, sensor kinase
MKREYKFGIVLFIVTCFTLFYFINSVTKSMEKHSYYCKESKVENLTHGDLLIIYNEKVLKFASFKGRLNDSVVVVNEGKDINVIKWDDIVELLSTRNCSNSNRKTDNCFCEVLWANDIIENPVLFHHKLTLYNISNLSNLKTGEKLVTIGSDKGQTKTTGIWVGAGIFLIFIFIFCIFIIDKVIETWSLNQYWLYVGVIFLSYILAFDQYNSSSILIFWLLLIQYIIIISTILLLVFKVKEKDNFGSLVLRYLYYTTIIFLIGITFEFIFLPVLSEILKLFDTNAYHQYTIENTEKEQFIFWSAFSLAYLLYSFFKYIDIKAVEYDKQIKNNLLSSSSLASIQSRINPHFLYNALNSIASLARTEPRKTEEMALQLAKFYGQCSNIKSKPLITLAEELEILKSYLMIEKIRFGDRLQVILPTDDDVMECMIPSFTLQPIVENAIKYGYNTEENVISIRITANTNDKSLTLRIYDSGPPFSGDMHSGYGLNSIAKKLKVLYPDRHTISFINEPEKCVEMVLSL